MAFHRFSTIWSKEIRRRQAAAGKAAASRRTPNISHFKFILHPSSFILSHRALSLVELLVSLTIVGLIAATAAAVLQTCLQAHSVGQRRSTLVHDGRLAMERMTAGARVGANHSTPADSLVFAVANPHDDAVDAHYYDSDSASGLFPRSSNTADSPTTLTYAFVAVDNTLTETLTDSGGAATVVLVSDVTSFSASLDPADATHDDRLTLSLTLTGEGGETMVFSETVFPRNTSQKWGRRVK